jgi:hypothetical protein
MIEKAKLEVAKGDRLKELRLLSRSIEYLLLHYTNDPDIAASALIHAAARILSKGIEEDEDFETNLRISGKALSEGLLRNIEGVIKGRMLRDIKGRA